MKGCDFIKFSEFAEINEELCSLSSKNDKVDRIVKLFNEVNDLEHHVLINLFTLNYPNIGVGVSGLVKRLEEYYAYYDNELEDLLEHYSSLSDLIEDIDDRGEPDVDEDASLELAAGFIYHDNYKDCYTAFFAAYGKTNIVGKKWLIRFILKEPRNGLKRGTIIKVLAKYHNKKQTLIKKASMSNTLSGIHNVLQRNEELDLTVPPGIFRTPMLAKGVKGLPRINVASIIDVKYDGIRAQIHRFDNEVYIFNRKGDNITPKFDDIKEVLINEGPQCDYVADGEIYPVDSEGKPDEFKKIMSRIHGKTQAVLFRTEVYIKLFDLLYYDETDIAETHYKNRLDILQENFGASIVATSIKTNSTEEMLEYYDAAITDGYEGVIIKPLLGKWEAGKRSSNWTKYKPARVEVDAIITGASYGSGKRSNVLASYEISLQGPGNYISVGSVGSGFSEEDLEFLTNLYNRKGPNSIIIEVVADILTKDKTGNYGLRFPRFIKYRDDKVVPTSITEVVDYA